MRSLLITLAIVTSAIAPAHAALNETQARLAAAEEVEKGASEGYEKIFLHLSRGILINSGKTPHCGPITTPTWLFMWDTAEASKWYGGYPVLINARTGKAMDCRS